MYMLEFFTDSTFYVQKQSVRFIEIMSWRHENLLVSDDKIYERIARKLRLNTASFAPC